MERAVSFTSRGLTKDNDVVVAGFALRCHSYLPGTDQTLVVMPARLLVWVSHDSRDLDDLQALWILVSLGLPAGPAHHAHRNIILHDRTYVCN